MSLISLVMELYVSGKVPGQYGGALFKGLSKKTARHPAG